jgi:recombinational DNA repair protein (RecF pathway)
MQPITQHAPLHGARLKKCAACGQVKPLTAYTARGHKRCSDCIGYTHGRSGANGRLE